MVRGVEGIINSMTPAGGKTRNHQGEPQAARSRRGRGPGSGRSIACSTSSNKVKDDEAVLEGRHGQMMRGMRACCPGCGNPSSCAGRGQPQFFSHEALTMLGYSGLAEAAVSGRGAEMSPFSISR